MNKAALKLTTSAVLLFWLGLSDSWALPPKVEADRLMIEAKTMMENKDYKSAVQNFAKLETLGVRLPVTFNYHYGVALLGGGDWANAKQRLEQYLTDQGEKGKFYKEALEKYNEAEREELAEVQRKKDEEAARIRRVKEEQEAQEARERQRQVHCDRARVLHDKGMKAGDGCWKYSLAGNDYAARKCLDNADKYFEQEEEENELCRQ